MSKAIGIDLGTTNSVAAYVNEAGAPEVIPSAEGDRTVPSVYSINTKGEGLVGKPAVDQETKNAANTVRSIKRKIGSSDRVTIGGKEMSPEEISAQILKKIKTDCEVFFGEPVTQAVITVPAYFDNNQRTATKTAGELAGFEVLRIINEPTAAALAYGLDKKANERVLVFDLGGGTFDVTILEISTIGIFDVKSTAGDTRLGGDDFDLVLMNLIAERFLSDRPTLVGHFATKDQETRLRNASEEAKKALSAAQSIEANIPYFAFVDGEPVHLEVSITRQEFETRITPIVVRALACVDQALKDAKMTPSDIDEVVFVGGSTRVPLVAQTVEARMGKKPNRSVNPDEAVALGAAVQAAILSGAQEANILLLDVTPLTLGVETLGGAMTPIIGRNTTIPVDQTEPFTTAEDHQKKVEVKVFQGERPLTKDCHKLGEFNLDELPPMPRGVPQIEVTFTIDANGILSVDAKEKLTGKEQTVTITGTSSLTSEEIQRIIADAEANKEADQYQIDLSKLRTRLQDQLVQVDTFLRDAKSVLSSEMTEDLGDLRVSIEQAVSGENHLALLESLALSAQEQIKETSQVVYAAAQQAKE